MSQRPDHFHALSVRDLLEAREAYHVHLLHKRNVFATAIGLYLIRDDDEDATRPVASATPRDEVRTLANSSHRDWSWPCILVFVSEWQPRAAFAADPDTMVPRFLYLPDGRVVPTCVVLDEPANVAPGRPATPSFPSDLVGGGYPCLTTVQGAQRLGTFGCLVTDGDVTYALTNGHVAGPAGRLASTLVAGHAQRVGVSAGRTLGKAPFQDVYAGWQGAKVMVNIDAGLITIDDANRWTAQIFGVGRMGRIWDLDIGNFNLDVIGCPVKAHGAASGPLRGQIRALFYRYKSIGGTEYVSDLLIGGRNGEGTLGTLPGDSGALWFEDATTGNEPPRPMAMQWGGQELSAGREHGESYGLATCLSTICRELDVDLIADWSEGHPETWGVIGHVKIGALACELVSSGWLHDMMIANQANIGVPDADLASGAPEHDAAFVPLADVADLVWRTKRPNDASNHFADMDQPGAGPFEGKTLLDLTADGGNIDPDTWNAFYATIDAAKRGALPFRVWSMVDAMVGYAGQGKVLEFVCAAGLVGHYVGDACQPLHISRLHHGEEGADKKHAAVHSVYETSMLAANAAELIAKVDQLRQAGAQQAPAFRGGGREAAAAVVALMHRTVEALPPQEIVDTFNDTIGRGQTAEMWAALGDRTAGRILDGASTLARIWEAAWAKGSGAAPPPAQLQALDREALADLYQSKDFTPSYTLQQLKIEGDLLVASTGRQ